MVLAVPQYQIMFLGSTSICASNRRYMPHSRLVVRLLQTLPVSLPGQSNHPPFHLLTPQDKILGLVLLLNAFDPEWRC